MRTLTAGLFTSLDGVIDVERADEWHFPYFNDELGAAVGAQQGTVDTLLLGRVTYDSFAGAWPDRERDGGEDAAFARQLGDARKLVVSHQPLEFTWRNTELVKGDLVEYVTALKRQPGDAIAMSGSPSVVRQLLVAGLIDELHLFVHPIVVGKGLRLVDETTAMVPLTLLSSTPFATGVVHAVYGPATPQPAAEYDDAKVHLG